MWYKSETAGSRPENVDAVSSKTTVFVRKDIVRIEVEGSEPKWEYLEQKISKEDWSAYTEIINSNSAVSISFVTQAENGSIDEVTAAEHSEVFAEWKPNISYKDSNIRRYGTDLYKCLQDHTSQEEWTPDISVSLWKKIGDPTVEYPEWSQPVGASDAYQTGDKVSHNNGHWVSSVNNNVWEPGVYGWGAVNE